MINRQSAVENRKLKAFTLIELLVVIAIISLLVSILLPSLSRAKELARRVVCLSQQRSIVLAQILYASENKDRILIGHNGAVCENYWIRSNQQFVAHGMLYEQEYLPDQMILYCPSVRPGCFSFDYHSSDGSDNTWMGHWVRACLVPRPELDIEWDVTVSPPQLANGVSWPRLVNFADKAICSDVCGYWDYPLHSHVDGVNIAFADASAQWVDSELFMPIIEDVVDHQDPRSYQIWPDVFDQQR